MRYMMMIYADEARMQRAPTEGVTKMSAAYTAYTKALKDAGVWRAGDALQPTRSATSVRIADGKTSVLDEAIAWAARCPGAANGTVELRPVWEMTS